MADKEIGGLTEATAIGATDEIHVVVSGNSRRVKGAYAGIAKGTSFPGSPATGMRLFRTDLKMEFVYDGTRWLSSQLYTLPIPPSRELNSATAALAEKYEVAHPGLVNGLDIWLEEFACAGFIGGTGNWDLTLLNTATASTVATIAGMSVDSVWTNYAASVTPVAVPTSAIALGVSTVENSGTATVWFHPMIQYRFIAT